MSQLDVKTSPRAYADTARSVIAGNKVLRNTYLLLSMTLLFSAAMAAVAMALNVPPMPWWVTLIGMFGLLFLVNATRNSAAGIVSVFAFTGFFGFILGPTLTAYLTFVPNGAQMVGVALGGTGTIFLAMSAYALTSKKDFSYMGSFLMIGVLVLFVAMLANIFLDIAGLQLAISAAAIVVFSLLMLYDTSRIINGGETNYLMATIALYLDIYNVFVHLLALTGIWGGDE